MTNFYPGCQNEINLALIEPTLLFKQQIVKAISCVVLFFILYVVLLLAAVALAVACIREVRCCFALILAGSPVQ